MSIKVTTTGNSYVKKKHGDVSVRHKTGNSTRVVSAGKKKSSSSSSSRADNPSQRLGTANPNNPTAPTVANAAKLNSPTPSSADSGVSTSSPDVSTTTNQVGFGGGGGGSSGSFNPFGLKKTTREVTGGEINTDMMSGISLPGGLAAGKAGTNLLSKILTDKEAGVVMQYADDTERLAARLLEKTDLDHFFLNGGLKGTEKVAGGLAKNTKVYKLVNNLLKDRVSRTTLGLITGWASMVAIGKWAEAEAGEPFQFIMPDLRENALKTGDFTLLHEAEAMQKEFTDPNLIKDILSWSPISPFISISEKIKAIALKEKVSSQLNADLEQQYLNGESENDYYERVRQQRIADEIAATDYFNEQRMLTEKNLRLARDTEREENAAFWKKHQEEIAKAELEQAKAQADFWLEYDKEKAKQDLKQAQEYAPSKLNFGLI